MDSRLKGRDALRGLLEAVLSHTADVFVTMVDIVSENYGVSQEEMIEVIKAHPKWTGMKVDPLLHGLTEVEPKVEPEPGPKAEQEPAKPKRQWSEEAKAAAAAKRAAKKAGAPAPEPPAPEPAAPEPAAPEPPAPDPVPAAAPKPPARKFVIKPKAKPPTENNPV